MDIIHLHGAEDVRSAANTIRNAAEDMRSAANTFAEAVDRQREFLDQWLQRLEVIMDPSIAAPSGPCGGANYSPSSGGGPGGGMRGR